MIYSKTDILLEILKASAPVYEVAIGARTGSTPMKIGVLLETFNECEEGVIGLYPDGPAEMATAFLGWIYHGAGKPTWAVGS